MRRYFLLTVLVLVFCFVLGQAASAQFDDAPKMDSWVYQSFKLVYDAGLIKGYPDGTFKGNRPATRNEVVEFMARLMKYFEARLGNAQPVQAVVADKQCLSEEEVKALIAEALAEQGVTADEEGELTTRIFEAIQDLEEQFKEDLDRLDVRVTTLEQKVQALEDKDRQQDETIAKLQADLAAATKTIEEIKAQSAQDTAQADEDVKKAKTLGTIGTTLGILGILLTLL